MAEEVPVAAAGVEQDAQPVVVEVAGPIQRIGRSATVAERLVLGAASDGDRVTEVLAQRPPERFVQIAHRDLDPGLPGGRLIGKPLVELRGGAWRPSNRSRTLGRAMSTTADTNRVDAR